MLENISKGSVSTFLRRHTIINSIVYILYITVINVYYKCKSDSKEGLYICIACHIKYNTYKMKREAYFTLDTTIDTLYNVLYYNGEMLHDGSIRCAQAGGPYQASRRPCFSPGMHCRASRVLEGGINMQDRSTISGMPPWSRPLAISRHGS